MITLKLQHVLKIIAKKRGLSEREQEKLFKRVEVFDRFLHKLDIKLALIDDSTGDR